MDNIRVKQESLSDWRSQFEIKEDQVDEGIVDSIKDKLNFVKHAKDTVNKYNNKLRKNADAINEIIPGTAKVSEEVEGGISVQNYADGVQFNEIETVDIIKAEPLNPSNWRNDLNILGEGNATTIRGIKVCGSGNRKDMSKGPNEKCGVDYSKIQAKADTKKEVVAASHEVEGELVDEGLVRGAIQGAGLLWKLGKWGIPKAARALRNKGAADINKFKKSQELVKRVNNIEKIRASKALKGTDVKGLFTKSKVKPGLNKVNWQATVPVTRAVSTTSSRLLSPASNTTTAHKIGTKLTKVKRQQITSRATEVLDQIKRGKKLQGRIDKAVSTSNKPGTLSQRTDDLIARIRADKGSAIVKSQKGSLATQKSRALTKLQNKSSSITNTRQTPSTITTTRGTSASDATINVKATTVKPKSLSPKPTKPYSAKREYAKDWMRYNKAADATLRADKASAIARTAASGLVGLTVGGKVGQELGKSKDTTKDLSIEKDKKELDTLKKQDQTPKVEKETPKVEKETPKVEKETPKVEKETPKVIKSSPKDRSSTEDSEKAAWLHKTRNSPAAKSGKFSDDQRWETQKKHRKWKADRKNKKEVSEGAVAAIRVGAKLGSKVPWGRVFGGASALTGLSGIVSQSRKDALPDGDPPADVQKQMDADKSIDVPGISMGNPDLEHHHGTKDKPKGMKDKYDKDALDNAKTDNILDPTGTQKTKPTLDQLRKHVNQKKKYKPKFNPRQNMTDKQIERMKKAGLL